MLGRDKKYRESTEHVFKKLTAELKEHYGEICGAKTPSRTAVVYSYENSWGTAGWTVDGFYDEEFFNAYGGFKNRLRTDVDVIGIDDDFSQYKLIVMPNHRITTEEQAEKAERFVRGGGVLVLNTQSGTREPSNQMRELLEPGLFSSLCGAEAVAQISASELETESGEKPMLVYKNGVTCALGGNYHVLRLIDAEPVAYCTAARSAYCSCSSSFSLASNWVSRRRLALTPSTKVETTAMRRRSSQNTFSREPNCQKTIADNAVSLAV